MGEWRPLKTAMNSCVMSVDHEEQVSERADNHLARLTEKITNRHERCHVDTAVNLSAVWSSAHRPHASWMHPFRVCLATATPKGAHMRQGLAGFGCLERMERYSGLSTVRVCAVPREVKSREPRWPGRDRALILARIQLGLISRTGGSDPTTSRIVL
ncbi:hypothetical protein VTK56DRAFT_10207 [Thermocarpiscus australiensis]